MSPLALLLFGNSLDVQHAEGLATVDGWLRIRIAARVAVLVKQVGCNTGIMHAQLDCCTYLLSLPCKGGQSMKADLYVVCICMAAGSPSKCTAICTC